eukprot:COSAG02_NODE_1852_length_10661_cov_3.072429_12_plen_76_part_00
MAFPLSRRRFASGPIMLLKDFRALKLLGEHLWRLTERHMNLLQAGSYRRCLWRARSSPDSSVEPENRLLSMLELL